MISAVTLGNNTSIAVSLDQQARQWQARQRKYELQDIMAELLPNDRVSWCLKHRQTGGSNIEIVYDQRCSSALIMAICWCVAASDMSSMRGAHYRAAAH